jgi:hypothetical protein
LAFRKPSDSTLITTWTGADSEVSLDGAAFADCANEATEIGTSGVGYIDLTAAEMNAGMVWLKVTITNSGAVTYVFVIYPESAGDYRVADTQKVDVETIKTQAVTCAAGVTVPSVIASTTNITAATGIVLSGVTHTGAVIPTVTTVTNQLSAATISTQVAADLAVAHGGGSWLTATGFSTHSAADVWAVGTRTITGGSLTTSPPTAAAIADAVWDEARSGHVTAGTFGEKVVAELDSAATAALVDLIWDEPLTGATHNVATSSGKRLRQTTAFQQIDSTVIDAAATATTFITGLTSSVDDFYNDSMLVFTDGALAGQVRAIYDYIGATKTIILEEALTSAPVNGVEFTIVSLHIHSVSQIQSGLATASALSTQAAKINKIEAATSGTVTGAGTSTEVFVGPSATLTITVDSSGNRSAVVVT